MMDDIQKEIEKVNKKIDQLMTRYQLDNVPTPDFYRLGAAEFMFRVVQLVLSELIKERFELSDDEFDLMIKKKWLEQAEMMLKNTKRMRMEAEATGRLPDQPKIFLPPGIEL